MTSFITVEGQTFVAKDVNDYADRRYFDLIRLHNQPFADASTFEMWDTVETFSDLGSTVGYSMGALTVVGGTEESVLQSLDFSQKDALASLLQTFTFITLSEEFSKDHPTYFGYYRDVVAVHRMGELTGRITSARIFRESANVPEPASLGLASLGMLAIAAVRRRRIA